MNRCVTDLALERYLLGELDVAADHIASCPQCLAAIAAKRKLGDAYMASPHAHDLRRLIATTPLPTRRRRVIMPAFAIALAAFAAYMVWPRAASDRDREAEVLAVEHAWTDAIVHNDVAALDAILAPDYKLTDGTGKVTTKSDSLAGMRERPPTFDAYDTSELQIRVWGDTAVVTGRSVMRGRGEKGPFMHDFTFTDTLTRIDGRWRAVAAHTSPTKR